MKIYADYHSHDFFTFTHEKAWLWGQNDVLAMDNIVVNLPKMRSPRPKQVTLQPRIYLHISDTVWAIFTGYLREYLLPWRWKAVYLDRENGETPERILLCTSVRDADLPGSLEKIAGKSLWVAGLMNHDEYEEIRGREFFTVFSHEGQTIRVPHLLGEFFGITTHTARFQKFYRMYRARDLISTIKYYFLKNFSSAWKEVDIRTDHASEKVLIQKSDEMALSTLIRTQ